VNRACLFLMVASRGSTSPHRSTLHLAVALEFLHKASVIRDDIEDVDRLRRREPTEFAELGVPVALALSDVLLMVGCSSLFRLKPEATVTVLDCMRQMALGQLYDIYGVPEGVTHDFSTVAELKTGSLISLVLWLAGLQGGWSSLDCARLGTAGMQLGTAFQLTNDINNVTRDEGREKQRGSDISSGRSSSIALILGSNVGLEPAEALANAVERVNHEISRRLGLMRAAVSELSAPLPSELERLLADALVADAFVADQQAVEPDMNL